MSPDAFRRLARLALLALASFTGLGLIAFYVNPWIALVATAGGGFVAMAVTIEQNESTPETDAPEREGLSRRDVERMTATDDLDE